MSIAVSTHVWRHCAVRGTSMLVLLALADWSDDNGCSYPSIRALAMKARISERQAQKQLASICQAGDLEVHLGMGPVAQGGRSNLYRIRLENMPAAQGVSLVTPPVTGDGVSPTTRRGVIQGRKGVSPTTPNTSENRQDTSVDGASVPSGVQKPEGVSDDVWRDFIAVLKAKRKVATPTYLESLRSAGKGAGLDLPGVIAVCAVRQWASFDPAWVNGTAAPCGAGEPFSNLGTKGGIDAAAKRLGLVQGAGEQRPQFDERVRQAHAESLTRSVQSARPVELRE
jgi:hypothetical protein